MVHQVHILGAGRAATGMARGLAQAGVRIGRVINRTRSSAERAVRSIGHGTPGSDPAQALENGWTTLIGVPDRELVPLAGQLEKGEPLSGASVLHLSGALDCEVLAPLRSRGCAIGSLHPAFSFSDRDHPPASLALVAFVVEGDAAACAKARQLVETLQGRCVRIDSSSKLLHHAAAAFLSNGLVALYDVASRLEGIAGIEPKSARDLLMPLLRSTVLNLDELGVPAALTGPIERGDVDIVQRHRQAIERTFPDTLPLWRELALTVLRIAERKHHVAEREDQAASSIAPDIVQRLRTVID